MATKNLALVALRTRAEELGVMTSGAFNAARVKDIEPGALARWVKNAEAALALWAAAEAEVVANEAKAAAEAQRLATKAAAETAAWAQVEADRLAALAAADRAERRSQGSRKAAATRRQASVPTTEVLFAGRRRETVAQAIERATAAPTTPFALALARAR